MDVMGSRGLLRRALPFFATFLIGVLISSFFVDISRPKFKGKRGHKHREIHRLKAENESLRNENLRLRNQLEAKDWDMGHHIHLETEDFKVPALDMPPMPPPPSLRNEKRSGR